MLLRQFIFIALYFYLKILNISCEERRTLAFAIDNTGSMENDIYNVKKGARKILDIVSSKKSTIEKFVLVAINDPKVKLLENTPNRNRFQASLNNLKISVDRKNRDCEEKSLSGIKLALRVSGPESYLYTFTDANAKDFTILSEITTLCQEKQTQIVTVFSIEKKCYYPEVRNFTAYYDIAKACSGQVFIVEKDEVNEVLKTIEILLQGKNSIFKWTMVPNSSKDAVTFTLDKKAEYALVSASGSNVTLKITTENDPNSPECPLDKIMSTNNGKFVKISNTNPGGTYYVWVKASSSVNVVVYGRTDFTFEYGFSDGELSKKESLKIKQPTAGLTQKLLINVYDLDHSVKMKTAQLFTIKNNKPVSVKMPLENVHDDLYITNAFIAPTETFRIEVEGIIKKANESITRYSSNIDPQLVLPVIQSINKGHVLKGSKIELICKIIQGFPKPLIKWYKKNRNKYIPLDVTGEVLTVNHALFKHVGEYKCTADNGITKTVEAKFDVIVHGLPEISIDKTERQVMFNNNDEITCKVASYPSPSIVWKNETGFALNGKVENISEYEFYNHLTLNNVRRNATYICEARNDFGNWTESVIIYVLSPFKVKNISIGKTNLNYGSETTILCEITSSEPMNIRWYIEKNDKSSKTVINSSDKYAISADRTELTIKSMDIDMNGTYSCEASLLHVPSEIKRNRFEVNIVGLDPPEINATEINLRVEKGEIIELDCKIIRGTPKPHVRWFKKNENNYVPIASVRGEVLRVNTALYAHSGQYKCEATNEIATATATYDVTVGGLPEIFVNGTTRLVQYNNDHEITCKVESYPRPSILWKNEHGLVLESRVKITSKHEFYNRLTLHNLKKSAIYICEASNVYGSETKQVNITVSSPFIVQKLTQDNTDVNYGSPQVILCKITSSEPMGIRWYREKHVKSSKIIIESSDKYAISADDTELTIKSMDIDTNGTYSCEASLLHVPSEITRNSFEVNVVGFAFPKIKSTDLNNKVMRKEKFELACNIAQGTPKPHLKWFKKSDNSSEYVPISGANSEVFGVNESSFSHAGQYKCEATNEIDTATATFDVTVGGLPEIFVNGTTRLVQYNNDHEITCKVESYPRPSILWKNEHGLVLESRVKITSKHEFYNRLTLHNLKKSAIYICEASNVYGSETKQVNITVSSPFIVQKLTQDNTDVNYGSPQVILCKITSSEPMGIRWYREKHVKSSKIIIESSDKYAISADDTELTIKSMDIDTNGTYSCEASLLHVPSEITRNSFEVNVVGFAFPKIKSTDLNNKVMRKEKFELACNIAQGTPKPHLKWFKKSDNSSEYVPISGANSEVFGVNESSFSHAGQYKCEATNEIDTATATFDVTVGGLPEIFVNGTTRLVQYNNDHEITCKVESYPRPSILWKNEHGLVLESRVKITSKHEFYNRLTLHNLKKSAIYICEASNVYGSETKQVNITVSSPFIVQKLTQDNTDVNYGSPQVILCKITSSEPMGIRWYREKHVKSSKIIIESSDKYAISADDTELTIKYMDIDTNGTYTCEASLLHVPSEITRNTFEVNVVGFASPKIKSTDLNNKVMRKEKFELACNIAQGTPKPHLKWFKKSDNSSEYVPISGANSEVFGVNESSFSHAGQYKCEATNEIDTATATFDVTVSGMPQIFIDNTEKQVSYNSYADITCKVEAYPPPSIVWMNETGTVLETKIEITSGYEFGNQLKLKNLKKNATIVCEARNKFGFIRKSVKILVSSPFVVKNLTHAITDIMYGSEKTIQCGISSKEKMNIRWYRQENDILSKMVISSSDKYDISSDGTELTIKSMDIDMNGTYSCEASLSSDPSEKASYSEEITVDGVNKPEVTYIMSHLNETLLMAICRIKAVPKPSIWWEFKPKGAKVFTVISRSSDEFKISEPKLKDSGVYKCKAKNILGETEHKFDITVEERPNISTNNSAYFGLERDLVMKIPCNVTGFPEPTIVWKKEDKPIRGDDKYRITGTALYINKPVQSDSAEYTCEAKNKLGNAIVKALVEIDDDFVDSYNYIYNGEIVETYVDTFEPKPIKCELENFGDDSVRWYQDGELTEHKGSTYFVEPDSIAYSSNYTCRVNTDEGSKSETYLVFFGYKPNFFNSLRNKINWRRNNQMLDCKAEADPEPKYEWFHNERAVVETENYMSKVHISGWGNYTCVVSNVLGNISRNFKVHTLGCFITKNIASQNQPLITNTDTPMWPPYMRNNGVLIKKNEEIKLSCPKNTKSTNYFKSIPGKIEVTAKCKTEDTFYIDGKVYRYSELECSTKVEPTVKDTKEQCAGPNTEMLRIGYEVNGFLDVYEVCYNKSLNVPLYARVSNKIYGDEENIDVTKFNWSSVLKLSHGKPENSCYTRRQLVSAKKIAFGPAQAATFKDDLNSILIWNTSCDGSGRKTWQNYDDETVEEETTWKGASGYALIDGVGLVPRYLWKVLATGEGYSVMVYVNGAAPTARDVRCAAPAHEACAWLADEGDALYCCTLEHFVDAFGLSLDKINSKLPVD